MSAETEARSRPCPRASEFAPHKQYRDKSGDWYCPIERSAEMAEADQRRREANANRTSRVEVTKWAEGDYSAAAFDESGTRLDVATGKHAAEALANLAAELIA